MSRFLTESSLQDKAKRHELLLPTGTFIKEGRRLRGDWEGPAGAAVMNGSEARYSSRVLSGRSGQDLGEVVFVIAGSSQLSFLGAN